MQEDVHLPDNLVAPYEFDGPSNFNDWMQIDSLNWPAGYAPGQEIKSYALTSILQRITPFFHYGKAFRSYTLEGIEFLIRMNTISTNSGSIRVAWSPVYLQNLDLFQISQLSNSLLYASTGKELSAFIPLVTPNRLLPLDVTINLLGLHIFVDRPLSNVTGTAISNQLQVYIRPRNLRFIDKRSNYARTLTSATISTTQLTSPWVATAIAQGREAAEKSSRGLISGVAEDVSSVADYAAKIPLFSPVASTISAVAKGVGSVAKWFGFGKPQSLSAVTTTLITQGTHLASANGLDPGTSLDVDVSISSPLSVTDMGEDDDISNFKTIAAKYSIFKQGIIAINAPLNTLLDTTALNPAIILSDGATPPRQLETNCAFVLNQFTLWRGDVKVRMHFPCDAFTKGTIQLILARSALPGSYTFDDLSDYLVETISINGPTVYEFTVPAPESDRLFYRRSCTAGNRPTNYDWSMGLYIPALFHSSSEPVAISWTMEIAVENLELAVPCNRPITSQGLFSGGKSPNAPQSHERLKVNSFRELMRRYSRAGLTTMSDPWLVNSEAKRVMSKFAFWKGTRRVSMQFITTNTTLPLIVTAALYDPRDLARSYTTAAATSRSAGGFNGERTQNVTQCSEMVLALPFQSEFRFLPTPRIDPNVFTNSLPQLSLTTTGLGVINSVIHYVAYGDDFQFGVLLPSLPYYVT